MANSNKPDQSNELSSTECGDTFVDKDSNNRPKLKISIPLDKLDGYVVPDPTCTAGISPNRMGNVSNDTNISTKSTQRKRKYKQ